LIIDKADERVVQNRLAGRHGAHGEEHPRQGQTDLGRTPVPSPAGRGRHRRNHLRNLD
jgi:hypothetical protein